MLSGYRGTLWTRFRSPEKPGYTVASPSPTGVPGDLDSILTTPLTARRGRKKKKVYYLCDNRTEEAYPHIKANNITSHHIPTPLYLVLFWFAAWLYTACSYCLVLIGHTILPCTRRSAYSSTVTVLRPSQAFHDVCECRILLAIFPIVAYRTCTVAGEVSLTPGAIVSGNWFPEGLSLQGYTQVWTMTGIYQLL